MDMAMLVLNWMYMDEVMMLVDRMYTDKVMLVLGGIIHGEGRDLMNDICILFLIFQ